MCLGRRTDRHRHDTDTDTDTDTARTVGPGLTCLLRRRQRRLLWPHRLPPVRPLAASPACPVSVYVHSVAHRTLLGSSFIISSPVRSEESCTKYREMNSLPTCLSAMNDWEEGHMCGAWPPKVTVKTADGPACRLRNRKIFMTTRVELSGTVPTVGRY